MNLKKVVYTTLMIGCIVSAVSVRANKPDHKRIEKEETTQSPISEPLSSGEDADSEIDKSDLKHSDFKPVVILQKKLDDSGAATEEKVTPTSQCALRDEVAGQSSANSECISGIATGKIIFTSDDGVLIDVRNPKVRVDEKNLAADDGAEGSIKSCRPETPDLDQPDAEFGMFDIPDEDIILPDGTDSSTPNFPVKTIKKGKLTYLPPRNDKWADGSVNACMTEFLVNDFRRSLKKYTNIFKDQAGIISIDGVTAVVGDVHGDYVTLRDIMDRLGSDLDADRINHVVFLGDILDRGPSSSITLSFLWVFFDKYPGKVHLLRGNHETMSAYVSGECTAPARDDPVLRRIDLETIRDFFDSLPYAAIINGTTLAVHGGIPHVDYWRQFWAGQKISEYDQIAFNVINGTLWSDYKPGGDGMMANTDRGFSAGSAAVFFDDITVQEFFVSGGIETLFYLIRGHQAYGVPFYQTPSFIVTTVFSAINGQDAQVQRGGASVALIPKDGPPIEYAHFR